MHIIPVLYHPYSREWICIIKILYVYILFALKIERRFQKSNIVFLSPLQSTIYQQYLVLIQLKYFVKLREREGQGVDPGRSLKGHLWMMDGGWWISFP